jgi:hypothetical protein
LRFLRKIQDNLRSGGHCAFEPKKADQTEFPKQTLLQSNHLVMLSLGQWKNQTRMQRSKELPTHTPLVGHALNKKK